MNFFINLMACSQSLDSSNVANNVSNPAAGQSPFASFAPLLVILLFILILYFISIRPNKKREKELKDKLSKLKKGDRVQTIGGWFGTVYHIKDKVLVLKIDENTKIEVLRDAISAVVVDKENEAKDADKTKSIEKSEEKENKESDSINLVDTAKEKADNEQS